MEVSRSNVNEDQLYKIFILRMGVNFTVSITFYSKLGMYKKFVTRELFELSLVTNSLTTRSFKIRVNLTRVE